MKSYEIKVESLLEKWVPAFPTFAGALEAARESWGEGEKELKIDDELSIVSGVAPDGGRVWAVVPVDHGMNFSIDNEEMLKKIKNGAYDPLAWWDGGWDNDKIDIVEEDEA